ncbi:predicted protein [Micromonas commoda]|uniref:Uncharacterized protein n=1 Tax=Micromonas commoda (strain RCC299 / NOUM17 / CCMP2709) TaxID=296587 RepID=C1FIH4_MICCC|nr:predicted protein [Micromonas commoda]ACO70425.1 predicted protein [Micromonas commoda]|eukprot:XP_002509167.1 predicted protein [Micromonas commoda]
MASCVGRRAGSLSEAAATGAQTGTPQPPPPPPPRPKKRPNPRRGGRGPGPACSAPGRHRPQPRDSARPSPPHPRRGRAPTGRRTGRSLLAPTGRPSGPNRRTRRPLPTRKLRPDPRRPCSRTRCSTRPAVTLTRGARWAGRGFRPSRGVAAPRPSPSRPASNGRNRWDPSEGLGPGSGSSWTTGRVRSTRIQTRRRTRRRRRRARRKLRAARCCPAAAACCPSRGRRRRRPGSSAPGRTTGGGSNRGQGYRDVPWTSALPTTSTRRGKWTVTTRE